MKKFIFEEDIRGLQGLKIDKEIPTEMSDKTPQHLTPDYELSHEDCVIKWKANGPSNFEQSTVV